MNHHLDYTRPALPLAAVSLLLFFVSACGGGGQDSIPPPASVGPSNGQLVVRLTDAPLDNLMKFEITVVSITLNPGNVAVLSQPERVELTSLQLTTEVIRLINVPAANYTSVTLQFSDPEIKFCPDPPSACTDQTLQEVQPPLQNASVAVNTNFSVVGNTAANLLIDFDLQASVVTVGNSITGVNPVVSISFTAAGVEDDELEAEGRVVSINRTNATSGTFVLEIFGSCQQVTLTVNSATEFEDFDEMSLANEFNSLAVNQAVEVDADVQPDTTLLTREVELEEPDDEAEAEGIILSVNRSGGLVTSFTLVAQEVAPCSAPALTEDVITVTVNANTQFRIDEDDLAVNTSLFDDAGDLEVGQKVEVDPDDDILDANITAERIKLQDQTIRGTVNGAPTPPNFELAPASTLLPDPSITVETSSQTGFEDVSGVSGLVSGQAVRVRGLVFRSGAGQLLLVAKKVDGQP